MIDVICVACDHEYPVAPEYNTYAPCPRCGSTMPKHSAGYMFHSRIMTTNPDTGGEWTLEAVTQAVVGINMPRFQLGPKLIEELLQGYADRTLTREQSNLLACAALEDDALFERMIAAHDTRMGRTEDVLTAEKAAIAMRQLGRGTGGLPRWMDYFHGPEKKGGGK